MSLVRSGESLIPKDRTYKQHLSHYQAQAKAMGVCKLHGLGHAYAQNRYLEITKLLAPTTQVLPVLLLAGNTLKRARLRKQLIGKTDKLLAWS